MQMFLDEVDLHVAAMLIMMAGPAGLLGGWWLAILLLLPQGRIGMRAFADYPSFGRRPWVYLAANEFVVGATTAATIGIRYAVIS